MVGQSRASDGWSVLGFARERVRSWRTGSAESQVHVLGVMLVGVGVSFVVSLGQYEWMPFTAYFVWLLVGVLLLRFRPLAVLTAVNMVAGLVALTAQAPLTGPRITAAVHLVVASALVLYQSSRQRSGLPMALSEHLLAELRDRLESHGKVPDLPSGWHSQSAMVASHGVGYAGDFLVANLSDDRRRLEIILVDVCGKGTTAGPAALQFAGALGGLLGALPPVDLFRAANDFLLRQPVDEQFATAVHLIVDLETGSYEITSAGHPPALRYDLPSEEWVIDNARGTALGVLAKPELHRTDGRLFPGEALLFYTDGVVESRDSHLDIGIAWLQRTAREAVTAGFPGAAHRVIGQVERGDDDRAVLILSREHPTEPGFRPEDASTALG
jgi:hypothetical protein